MKKTLIVLAVLSLISAAHANPTACPTLEFAELQTYTEKELMAMWSENFEKMVAIGPADMREFQNCDVQATRILRIAKTKKDAQATPPAK